MAHERKRRKWTQEQLAEAVTEHGGRLDRAAIAKIESGVRNVSIDEAFLLAAALNVPPPLILLPLGQEDLVQITPKSQIHPHLALDWLTGQEALTSTDRRVIDRAAWLDAARRLDLWDRLRELQHEVAQETRTTGLVEGGTVGYRVALERLHTHLMAMVQADLRPPAMSDETLRAMGGVGLDVSELEEV